VDVEIRQRYSRYERALQENIIEGKESDEGATR
jgi:hypothetical protein